MQKYESIQRNTRFFFICHEHAQLFSLLSGKCRSFKICKQISEFDTYAPTFRLLGRDMEFICTFHTKINNPYKMFEFVALIFLFYCSIAS